MALKPINFTEFKVKATLEGRKTQDRIVMPLQPGEGEYYEQMGPNDWAYISHGGMSGPYKCKYAVGDILYVKETVWQAGRWYQSHPEDDEWSVWIGNNRFHYLNDGNPPNEPNADYPTGLINGEFSAAAPNSIWRKRPSIHMPKEACRLFIKVTSIKAERLQDITGYDVLKEGIGRPLPFARSMTQATIDYKHAELELIKEFTKIWDEGHRKQLFTSNPFVFTISYEVIDNPLKK